MIGRPYLRKLFLIAAILIIFGSCVGHKTELNKLFNFKSDFYDFSLTYGPNYYSKETIFNYIDGAADGYLALGYRELVSFELAMKSNMNAKLNVDVYDMGKPENAAKILSKENAQSSNMFQLAKGKYYIKIISNNPLNPDIFQKIAASVASKIIE